MKIKCFTFYLIFWLLIPAMEVNGQNSIIIQKEISTTRTLSGTVDIGLIGLPAEGISVSLCSINWVETLASVQTDAAGHFQFGQPLKEGLYYLRLSAAGVNTYQLRIRIKKKARSDLRIHLSNAT